MARTPRWKVAGDVRDIGFAPSRFWAAPTEILTGQTFGRDPSAQTLMSTILVHRPNSAPNWANFGNADQVWASLAILAATSADFDRCWAILANVKAIPSDVFVLFSNSSMCRIMLVNVGANSANPSSVLALIWARSPQPFGDFDTCWPFLASLP